MVLRRKALGIEALTVQRTTILGGRYPTLAGKLQELTALRAQVVQKTLAGPGSEDIEVHRHILAEWARQRDRLEEELARLIPEMDIAQKLQSADHQAVARALPQEAVLVEFVRFKNYDFQAIPARNEARWKSPRYAAFVLHAGGSEDIQFIDLGEADPIDQHLALYITALDQPAPLRFGKSGGRPVTQDMHETIRTGRSLRKHLFDALAAALGDCKRLFLAPDGDLARLPFEVLPTDDGHYLIDEYQISYLSTGRDMLAFERPFSKAPAPSLVVADPDFNLRQVANPGSLPGADMAPSRWRSQDLTRNIRPFEPLPGTRIEGQKIATLFEVQPLLAEAALEAPLKASRSPRILHIATHGFFLPDQPHATGQQDIDWHTPDQSTRGRLEQYFELPGGNPLLRSGLALAGANTWIEGASLPEEAEDGLLLAEDVSGMDLLDTELVVLSACETGLGEVHIGEGVFGLRRAFAVAGARTLVMSLWRIPDTHTQELMEQFYHHLLKGQPRADALRIAQLAIKEEYPHPFYWGAFICQGDPNPLLLGGKTKSRIVREHS